jgi:hypothetical protein
VQLRNLPLVSQNPSIIDQNGHGAKGIDGSFDDGSTVGDRRRVNDGLSAS